MIVRDLKLYFYLLLVVVSMNVLLFLHNFQLELSSESIQEIDPKLNFTTFDLKPVIERILNETRRLIRWELRKYNWNVSGVAGIDKLITEKGGRPFKAVIISPWRSGSTFIGSILASLPGVLYFFEPLAQFVDYDLDNDIRNDNISSLMRLKNLLKCESFDESYISLLKGQDSIYSNYYMDAWNRIYYHDNRMWSYCKENHNLCADANFRENFCKLFPFLVVKDVHVRLQFVEDLLDDEDANVRVVVVVRDPRAILWSRRSNDLKCSRFLSPGWCVHKVDPICEDMVQDHASARRLLQRYPRRIKILRFEDLALNPINTLQDLLQFLNLHMTSEVEGFFSSQRDLDNHTGSWISESDAFRWKGAMNFELIDSIQDTCKEAMNLWGYIPAYNWTHQQSDHFLPISNYEVGVEV